MWIINCILLIMGTISAVFGISFYFRNREASNNIRFYILSYGISAALWCLFFGMIGFCADLEICNVLRKIGDIGIICFLITETFLVTDITGVSRKIAGVFKSLAVATGIVDYLAFSRDNVSIFVRENGWTTWFANPAGAVNRSVHSVYAVFTFLVLFSFGIVWMRNNKVKRLRRFLYLVFAANFNILLFSIPDTLMPLLGRTAVPTSGIGGALCAIVMWYGATQLGSFDIRTGNIKDRLFDFIEAGVIVFEEDRKVAMMNRYSRNLAESLEITGSRLEDFFDINAEEVEEAYISSMDKVYTERLWGRGSNRAYSVRLSAVKDNYGEVFCFLCVFVDVTEEVEAVSKFEIASRAKSRFLAQMSHEIRTPINAVLGMNEMILRESEDKEILEYASNIDSAGNTLLSLINSILDFSKIEDGKMEIVPIVYNTASFINDLYHSIIQRAETKGLAFILEADPTLPAALIGDDVRVSQVIMNLLTNAVKYTEKGSVTLSLRVKERKDGKVKIAVAVKDTGIGIREEDREKLFVSFERLDEVRNHNIEGTGLGISIVTSLLDMMGSRLELVSSYGEGSVFSFVIEQEISDDTPIGDYEERLRTSDTHKDKVDVINAPSARILVVDDNDMNLKVARNLLKLCGIKPEEASSGEETIAFMRQEDYDIVFLDHMMPGMDGIETLHRLQEEKLIPDHTVIIALTANAVVGARESYLAEGFTDYLSKPIEIKHLVEKLKVYLPETAYRESDVENILEYMSENIPENVLEYMPENVPGNILENVPGKAGDSRKVSDDSAVEGNEIMEFEPEDEDGIEHSLPGDEPEIIEFGPVYDLDRLRAVGVDVNSGLNFCAGDQTFYLELLNDFVLSCQGRLQEIEHLFHDENWHGYEVAVHALKSNARMIGAMDIYERAKELEEAGEKDDIGFIKGHHEGLIQTAISFSMICSTE